MSVAARSNEKNFAGFFMIEFKVILASPAFNMLNLTVQYLQSACSVTDYERRPQSSCK